MRATSSITWLLLLPSLGMCSTSSSNTPLMPSSALILSTNAGTTVNPTTIEPTIRSITTPTNEPQVTNAPEITTSVNPSSDLSKTSTQTMTNAAATPVTSLPSKEPEQTPPPKTTKSSSPPAPTSDGYHLTTAGALPLGPATISKSRTTVQTTPPGTNRSLIQTTTASQPSNPSDQPSELPTSLPDIQGNKGTTLNTDVPTSAPPPEKTSTKSWPGTEAGSTSGLSSTGPRSTVKPNFSVYTPSQTTITPPNTEAVASHPTDGTTTQIIFDPKVLPNKFTYSLVDVLETVKEKGFAELCKKLMPNWQNGTCILMWRQFNDKVHFDSVEINGQVKTSLAEQYYEEMTQEDISTKPTDYKTLIAILASCGALLIMIIILTVCASHHRKPCNENQQYLTEELHTVENCYHDNPTLEVMEAQPEMQEKKVVLNGEFNDSWIVPIDNMMKEDILDEEDTHL